MISPFIQTNSQKMGFSELIGYLISLYSLENNEINIPPMNELSQQLGISQNKLREQLEVAKSLGMVEVHPRKGIHLLPYSFVPAVSQSLMVALSLDCWNYFEAFNELRNHIEASYWHQAVSQLTSEDHASLQALIECAWLKLKSSPIQIPHHEHKELHVQIYHRLDNPFALGILDAYWKAYETVGLNLFTDYNHLEKVWDFHAQMVEAICDGDFDAGYKSLISHKLLLFSQPQLSK